MSEIQLYTNKIRQRFFTKMGREKSRVRRVPRFTEGSAELFGKPFLFHDSASFLDSYKEIFEHEIYRFNPSSQNQVILDCGANIGLSVLFFAKNYPNHTIIAFEPDDVIFDILSRNVKTFNLTNVQLHKKAVWNKEEVLEFFTDNGMGARVGYAYENQEPKKVQSVRLKDFLANRIDFLKIDIEGAEYAVLTDCADALHLANKIFFEYHGHHAEPQKLHELLLLLQQNGFHYYIKESSTRQRPFVDDGLICEVYDMAINIFGYRNGQQK
jgi:FkbM family methyltransferase